MPKWKLLIDKVYLMNGNCWDMWLLIKVGHITFYIQLFVILVKYSMSL